MKSGLVILIALILIGGGFGNFLRYVEQKPDRAPDFSPIPIEGGGYFGVERRFSDLSYEILQADTTTLRRYSDQNGNLLWLFIAYFSSQKYGSQIHSPKHCLPGGGWRIDRIEPYRMQLADGHSLMVNRLLISERAQSQVMFYWFRTRSGTLRNEFGLKFDLMKNSLLLRPTDAAIVRLTLSIAPGENIEATTARATRFLDYYLDAINRALPFQD